MNKTIPTLLLGLMVTSAASAAELTAIQVGESTKIRGNGTLQIWAIGNENVPANAQLMRLRRAELKATVTVFDTVQGQVMIDPAKMVTTANQKVAPPAGTIVQDLNLSVKPVAGLELVVGQMKLPTTAEGLDPTTQLPLPERSLVGRTYGDRRELGVSARFRQERWNVSSMVSTCQSIGNTGHRGLRDLSSRFELTPNKLVSVGTFATLGDFEYLAKGRYGLNARYHPGKADLRAEFSHGRTGSVHGQGVTTEAGYWFTEHLEAVVRFDSFVPNQAAATRLGKAESIGMNYLIPDFNSKVQFSASSLQNMAADNGTAAYKSGVLNREVTLAYQASI